ncbi:hypothetical protein [Tabrizicola sp.]|uniref:hypothetical protein n=1 Tax=Tabrizicola sp. TaxID=2005166 RepID=UPI00273418AB|nr:hypothetical protein [Tabrizicola sp.]MDP3194431.1 hypothetical protein [Tabrizicola sp.]
MKRALKKAKPIKQDCIAYLLEDDVKVVSLRTWSERWDNPGESFYALVAQFGALNALTNVQLSDLFVKHTFIDGGSGLVWREFAVVDFRDGSGLDLEYLAFQLRMELPELKARSTAALMPNSLAVTSNVLVWCPTCVKTGHHLCTMQLPMVRECPRHRKALLRSCPKCKSSIPYMLKRSAKVPMFACLQCGHDLAPATREPQNFVPYPQEFRRVVDHQVDYLSQMDKLPILLGNINKNLARKNYEIKLSKPNFARAQSSFSEFVGKFLSAVVVVNHIGHRNQAVLQINLPFEQMTSRSSLGLSQAKKGSIAGATRIGLESEQVYIESTKLYRAVRRHVQKSIVGQHMRCVKLAQRALWWDNQGERTVAFCPVAMAFMRWRMQWESRRAIGQLPGSKQTLTMLGIVGWIAAEQPVALPTWRAEFFSWLRCHLLGTDLIDSMSGWITFCQREYSNGHVIWRPDAHEHFARHHWGCCGGGTSGEPGYLFFDEQNRIEPQHISKRSQWIEHCRQTELLVSSIKR